MVCVNSWSAVLPSVGFAFMLLYYRAPKDRCEERHQPAKKWGQAYRLPQWCRPAFCKREMFPIVRVRHCLRNHRRGSSFLVLAPLVQGLTPRPRQLAAVFYLIGWPGKWGRSICPEVPAS